MLVSNSKKFIYIHVDRTGGTTFSKAFKKYTRFQWSHRTHQVLLGIFGEIPSLYLLKEQSALELRSKIPAKDFNSYFKFSMIRNPWEWLVSDYSYRQQNPLATYHETASKQSFRDYVNWRLQEKYEDIDNLNLKRGLSARFTDTNGKILVDYVGRFENFQKEFNFFCKKIQVKAPLDHLNSSQFGSYRNYYDDDLIDKVHEFFALDIKLFNYSF